MEAALPLIWLFIIGFFLLYYAVTDGFDLGVGIISLFCWKDPLRDKMMASLETIWHTNQTWLVVLGGMVFGAFPLFYGVVFSALYIPIVIMIFALMFRGVAFDFREHSQNQFLWKLFFGFGSLAAAVAQGFALGGLLGGLDVENGRFAGNVWGWFTPFSCLVAVGTVFGYTMLGANYLILKTEGELQERGYRYSRVSSILTLCVSIGVYLWVTAQYPQMAHKWSSLPGSLTMAVFPVLAIFSFIMFYRSLWKRSQGLPLFWNALVVLFSFVGLSVGLYPDIIPNVISPVTVAATAASSKTLIFMLVVMAILIPVILTYTSYTYRTFRGKATDGQSGYQEE